MVGPNFRVGKKIGCGNFGELRLGKFLINLKKKYFKIGKILIKKKNFVTKTWCFMFICAFF